ncbi:MAG: SIS domain-containing protein [Paludibacter sp.]|nr:SIS domain-containing protein [Paludibacter sp.]
MKYLNIDEAILKDSGAFFTAKEISGQPELWMNIFEKVVAEKAEIMSFLDDVLKKTKKIILTGAGTSGYIGYSIEGVFQRRNKITTISIPTTHLVSHPQDYFDPKLPTLLVSFARSGNSPESVAAVKLADKYCDECYHLVITCDTEGNLAKCNFKNSSYVFILPSEANDKSLAMTGSYSGMLLSALLINDIKNIDLRTIVETLQIYGHKILGEYLETIKKVACLSFKRAVFLGSGPQYGTAMESHLKLQELSDGQVICKNDSYLGFRHGPKAVVDGDTLIVYYFSNKKDVFRYERDLVVSMENGNKPLFQLGIAEGVLVDINIDEKIVLSNESKSIGEEYLSVSNILLGQLLGYYKSLAIGLKPDSPSQSGAISRVVQGVTIY